MKTPQEIRDKINARQAGISQPKGMASRSAELAWQITTVDAPGGVGESASLAFSPDGQPTISYHDYSNGDLQFAQFTGLAWSSSIVDAAGDVGQHTDLAYDPNGRPAIASYDLSNGHLKFARKGLFKPAP